MKARIVADRYETPRPWVFVNKRRYGDQETYRRAAAWLYFCRTVADWGGGAGWFKTYLPSTVQYTNIDGTLQQGVDVVADLAKYHERSEGIMLRHVVDNTPEPWTVLANAVAAYEKRLVVVTYTPHAPQSIVAEYQFGWPVWHLNHQELLQALGPGVIKVETTSTGAERVYCLERRRT